MRLLRWLARPANWLNCSRVIPYAPGFAGELKAVLPVMHHRGYGLYGQPSHLRPVFWLTQDSSGAGPQWAQAVARSRAEFDFALVKAWNDQASRNWSTVALDQAGRACHRSKAGTVVWPLLLVFEVQFESAR